MSQNRARDGVANDWHLVSLGRFALGGAGLVIVEATAVEERGRRTHGDLGLWNDAQTEPLARIAQFISDEGAVPGVQLGRAGRKASIRRAWPRDLPLVFRLSATDWMDGGWTVEDTIFLAKALKAEGVDMIDVSTGGIGGTPDRGRPARMTLGHAFQTPFATQVRDGADIAVMTVGMIWDAKGAEKIIADGQADMIAMARELLDDPNWPLHATAELGADERRGAWPPEAGWWLDKRDRITTKLGLR